MELSISTLKQLIDLPTLRNMRYEQSAKHQLNIEITIENIEINGFIILLHITGFTSHESFDLNNLLQPLKAM